MKKTDVETMSNHRKSSLTLKTVLKVVVSVGIVASTILASLTSTETSPPPEGTSDGLECQRYYATPDPGLVRPLSDVRRSELRIFVQG